MKKVNSIILLLTFVMAVFKMHASRPAAAILQEKEIKFEHISIEDGLSQSSVYSIYQDRKGFMWFGTHDGLNKYDGNKITIYTNEPNYPLSISPSTTSSIYEDANGVMWLGSLYGLLKFDREKEIFIHYQHDPGKPNSISDNFVRTIFEDRNGVLWIGTLGGGLNKMHRETGTFTCYKSKPGDSNSPGSDTVNCITDDSSGALWIGTDNGLHKFNPQREKFSHYLNDPANPQSISNNKINYICKDRSHPQVFWIGTGDGLNKLDTTTGNFTCYKNDPTNPNSLSGNIILSILEDRSGLLWIGTSGSGLNIFDRNTGQFIRFYADPKNPHGLSFNEIQSLYEDRSGVIWIGTIGAGLNIFTGNMNVFSCYRYEPGNLNSLSYSSIWCFCEEPPGIIWIGTQNGLNKFDRQANKFFHYYHDPNNPNSLSHNNVMSMYRDRAGFLWMGTRAGDLIKFDPQSGNFISRKCISDNPKDLDNMILSIAEDKTGIMWIGTKSGLYTFDQKSQTSTHSNSDPQKKHNISNDMIYYLYEDDPELWIGTGVCGLCKYNRETNAFTYYTFKPNTYNCISNNSINCIYKSKSGILWVSTRGGGLNKFNKQDGTFTHYTTKNGLPNNIIYGILEDNPGNLWLSTNKGISRFNPTTETFKNYDLKSGIQGYEYNWNAHFKSKDGELFFGGPNGFNSFYPEMLKNNPFIPPVVITDLKLFDKTVDFKPGSPLEKHITYTDEITLSYRDNIFTIDFAALEFTNPPKNQYKYMMEGLHKKWINLGYQHNISFTGLEPGKYIFRVTGSNNDGIWNETGTSLKIIITPPFWRTWWFRTLGIAAILMLFLAWHKKRMANLSLQLKSEAEMERLFEKHNISSREKEIIQLILKGRTNKDIEDDLYISVRTVKNHIYNIYQKFDVNSRLELIHEIQKTVRKN